MRLDVVVLPNRPRGNLIGRNVQPAPRNRIANIELASADELPLDSTLTFSVRTESPPTFAHNEAIEIATADNAFSTLLSLGNGGLTLQDAKVALATLEPRKAFGPSAFGALQYRFVIGEVAGDWQPLMTLVRLPALTRISCRTEPADGCQLAGAKLFLIDSVSGDVKFKSAVKVPDGFPGFSLSVPQPVDGRLFLRLRDDPTAVNAVTFASQPSTAESDAPAGHTGQAPAGGNAERAPPKR